MSVPAPYAYGGARVLVALHAGELRHFLDVWRRADALDVALPETDDPCYASREVLLVHVLACAGGYLNWICEKTGKPSPALDVKPDPEGFDARADEYVDRVLAAWDTHLRDLTEEESDGVYESRWGVPYCIDSMLEHAVMHPVRHTFQLQALIDGT